MILKSIEIKNYRSIEQLKIETEKLEDGSRTFALIGVNEAGKSSILKAIGLKDNHFQVSIKDFKTPDKDIEINFSYLITDDDKNWLDNVSFDTEQISTKWTTLDYSISYGSDDPKTQYIAIKLSKSGTLEEAELEEADLADSNLHDTVYWTSDDQYLISKPITLSSFATTPSQSVPLKNCFLLAGYSDIPKAIRNISDSTEKSLLQDNLSEATTEHIKQVWPDHPINIRFEIDNGILHFHIKDDGVKKAKTTDQRSDGFRQFISFLLTVSAEDRGGLLSNKILLLDEPETHLHPQAQINLLNELKSITLNDRNNLVLFATHSGFLIDAEQLDRNYRVSKEQDETKIEQFRKDQFTYARIMYEVFDIPSKDYHSELFTDLHFRFLEEEAGSSQNANPRIKHFDEQVFHGKHKLPKTYPYEGNKNSATLPTYIRNCINHPGENSFKNEDLIKSINLMRGYLGH